MTMKQIRECTTEVDGRPVNPEDIIDNKVKARAADLRAVPKEERLKIAHQTELQGAVLKRAQRMSESWNTEEQRLELRRAEKTVVSHSGQVASELEARAQRVRKSWAVPEEREKSFSAQIYHHGSSEQPGTSTELPTTESGLNEFVDNLFDPVLSSDVDDLGDVFSLSRSIKGGGKMYRSSYASPQTSSPPTTSTTVPSAYMNGGGLASGVNGPTFVLLNNGMPNGGTMIPAAGMPYQTFMPGMTPGMPGMNGYIPVQYPMTNGMTVQGLPSTMPITMVPVSNEQQPRLYQTTNDDVAIQRKLEEQERKLAERQAELAKLSEKLDTMKKEQQMQLERTQEKQEQQQKQQQQQQQQLQQPQYSQANQNEQHTRTRPLERRISDGSDYLGNKPSRYSHHPTPGLINSFLKAKSELPPPSEFRDRHPLPPSPPRNSRTTVISHTPHPPPPPLANGDHTDGFVRNKTDGGVASVILALHNQKNSSSPAPGASGKMFQTPSVDLPTTSWTVVMTEKSGRTELYRKCPGPYLTYQNVRWKLYMRKELFMPNEKLSSELTQHLVFRQIVWDTYKTSCCRMTRSDRHTMKQLLEKYGIYPDKTSTSSPVEEIVIDAAKQLPYYFCRFYKVSKQNVNTDYQFVAVSHNGVQFIRRERITNELETVEKYLFGDIIKVRVSNDKLTFKTKIKKLHLYTEKAAAVKKLIDPYLVLVHEKDSKFVKAKFDYITNESTLLSFKQGDVINLVAKGNLAEGWLYGELRGNQGYFPAEYVTDMHERKPSLSKSSGKSSSHTSNSLPRPPTPNSVASDHSSSLQDGRFSMLEFAMKYFRYGHDMYVMQRKKDGSIRGTIKIMDSIGRAFKSHRRDEEWSWKNQADLVKFSKSPIQASLLKLDSSLLNKKALESFITIMKYMGDYVMIRGETRGDLVYFLLLTCREYPELKDEVYCQLIKQVTSNKSNRSESCSNGWRLFIALSAYLQCSDVLRPYLVRFLQTISSDPKREFHGAAASAEMNLLKTLKYGGRRTEPTPGEMEQLVQGRTTKRLPIYLPGGITKVLKVQTCSTGYDVIKDLCSEMDLSGEEECNEFGLFTFLEREKVLEPLRANGYVMDVISTLDRKRIDYHMHFRRVMWFRKFRFENKLLVDLLYNQVCVNVRSGDLLGGQSFDVQLQNDVSLLNAIEYHLQGKRNPPVLKDIADTIPSCISGTLRAQQWVILIQDHYKTINNLAPDELKKRYLEIVKRWRYFGSTFFRIKHCTHPRIGKDCTLVVNKEGVHFLDSKSKETLLSFSFVEIISTRLLISGERGRQFLDLKCGNLMVQKVTRIETHLGRDIADLVDMYFKFHNNEKMVGILRPQHSAQHNAQL